MDSNFSLNEEIKNKWEQKGQKSQQAQKQISWRAKKNCKVFEQNEEVICEQKFQTIKIFINIKDISYN